MKTLFNLSYPLALVATLAAQDADSPLRLAPKDAFVVARFDAPARWSAQETQLARFLSGPIVSEIQAALPEELLAMLEEAESELPPEVRDVLEALQQSTGHFSFALELLLDDPEEPGVRAMLALTPGADDDLDGLVDLCAAAFDLASRESEQPIVEQPFGDETLRVIGDDLWVSAPQRIGEDLVLFWWTGERDAIEPWARLGDAERFMSDAPLDGSFALRVNVGPALEVLTRAAEQEAPFPIRAIFERFGFLALDRFDMSIRPAGEYVVSDFELRWNGDGGIFEAMVPEGDGRLDLLELAPWHAPSCSVSTARIAHLYDVFMGLFDELEGAVPFTRDEAEAAFEEEFKVRLREDLFDHLGDEVLAVSDENYGKGDPEDPLFGFAGQAFAVELKDAAAFGRSFETMLRARGMHAARKTTRYRDFDLHRLKLLGMFDLDYVVSDRLFAVSVGTEDPIALRSILDEEAARRAGEPPAEMPEAIAKRLELAPAKLAMVGAVDATMMADSIAAGLRSSAAGEPEAEDIAAFLERLRPLAARLREAGLDRLVSTGDAEPGRLRFRYVW